jgi:hypothetical protein
MSDMKRPIIRTEASRLLEGSPVVSFGDSNLGKLLCILGEAAVIVAGLATLLTVISALT